MPITIMGKKYYDLNEVADMLHMSRRSVGYQIQTGKLIALRFGRFKYVEENDMATYLENLRMKSLKLEKGKTTND